MPGKIDEAEFLCAGAKPERHHDGNRTDGQPARSRDVRHTSGSALSDDRNLLHCGGDGVVGQVVIDHLARQEALVGGEIKMAVTTQGRGGSLRSSPASLARLASTDRGGDCVGRFGGRNDSLGASELQRSGEALGLADRFGLDQPGLVEMGDQR